MYLKNINRAKKNYNQTIDVKYVHVQTYNLKKYYVIDTSNGLKRQQNVSHTLHDGHTSINVIRLSQVPVCVNSILFVLTMY